MWDCKWTLNVLNNFDWPPNRIFNSGRKWKFPTNKCKNAKFNSNVNRFWWVCSLLLYFTHGRNWLFTFCLLFLIQWILSWKSVFEHYYANSSFNVVFVCVCVCVLPNYDAMQNCVCLPLLTFLNNKVIEWDKWRLRAMRSYHKHILLFVQMLSLYFLS